MSDTHKKSCAKRREKELDMDGNPIKKVVRKKRKGQYEQMDLFPGYGVPRETPGL